MRLADHMHVRMYTKYIYLCLGRSVTLTATVAYRYRRIGIGIRRSVRKHKSYPRTPRPRAYVNADDRLVGGGGGTEYDDGTISRPRDESRGHGGDGGMSVSTY